MELDPGYITREDMPLGPRIFTDALFEGLADPLVGVLGSSDAVLLPAQTAIASNTGDGLDAQFQTTIGGAIDTDNNQPAADGDQTASALIDRGAGAQAYHDAVQRYLPQPETPINGDFLDVPIPPAGHGAGQGGGDDGNGGI